jgi:hypothetical protein
MVVAKRAALSPFPLACALALVLTLFMTALVPHGADAQIIRDHRTPPIVRDHRARECRVTYSEHPGHSGFPAVIGFCALPSGDSHPLGSFCTCSKLIEGVYQTVGGKIVLVSEPNG